MASIAYITDKNMIEFHRLNGNHTICFWKPSNTKKISDFNIGDYLFFLAKGTERGQKREKGIIGYGKLKKSYTMSFNQMWKKFESLNGYPTKEALEDAILRVIKHHELPSSLNCFLLEEVAFFQSPIYLSDIDIEISNHIESNFYIDKDQMTTTSKILEVANDVGFDMWSGLFQTQDEHQFKRDAKMNLIYNIYNKIQADIYSNYDESRLAKFAQACIDEEENAQFIANSRIEYVQINHHKIEICIPCIINTQDFDRKFQYIIGHYELYKVYIKMHEKVSDIDICIVFNQTPPEEIKLVLNNLEIKYKEKLVTD